MSREYLVIFLLNIPEYEVSCYTLNKDSKSYKRRVLLVILVPQLAFLSSAKHNQLNLYIQGKHNQLNLYIQGKYNPEESTETFYC